jgi:hypothetical protein
MCGVPPLERPATDAPERHRPMLAAAARGQDAPDLDLGAAARPARVAGRR